MLGFVSNYVRRLYMEKKPEAEKILEKVDSAKEHINNVSKTISEIVRPTSDEIERPIRREKDSN